MRDEVGITNDPASLTEDLNLVRIQDAVRRSDQRSLQVGRQLVKPPGNGFDHVSNSTRGSNRNIPSLPPAVEGRIDHAPLTPDTGPGCQRFTNS